MSAFYFAEDTKEQTYVQTSPIENEFGYVSIGGCLIPLTLPKVGLGYRSHRGHQGIDVSGQLGMFSGGVSVLYLHYPYPNLKRQRYQGIGVSGAYYWPNSFYSLSPKAVFGKEYINKKRHHPFCAGRG